LDLINEKVPVSVLMHILIAISYLSKDDFKDIIEDCKLHDKIAKFIEKYSQINTTGESHKTTRRWKSTRKRFWTFARTCRTRRT